MKQSLVMSNYGIHWYELHNIIQFNYPTSIYSKRFKHSITHSFIQKSQFYYQLLRLYDSSKQTIQLHTWISLLLTIQPDMKCEPIHTLESSTQELQSNVEYIVRIKDLYVLLYRVWKSFNLILTDLETLDMSENVVYQNSQVLIEALQFTIQPNSSFRVFVRSTLTDEQFQYCKQKTTSELSNQECLDALQHLPVQRSRSGIINTGNSCYVSVVLQTLFSIKTFALYFLSDLCLNETNDSTTNSKNDNRRFIYEFSQLIQNMYDNKISHNLHPGKMMNAQSICNISQNRFELGDQQDYDEFLIHLLETMSNTLNRNYNTSNSSSSSATYDTIIIGAGTAGLSAAYELCKQDSNHTVLVLEKSSICGGNVRTATVTLPDGSGNSYDVDFGVVQLWGTYHNVLEIMQDLKVPELATVIYEPHLAHFSDNTYKAYQSHDTTWSEKLRLLMDAFRLTRRQNNLSMYEPNAQGLLQHKTIADALEQEPILREYISIIYPAYTYGSIDEVPAFLAIASLVACFGLTQLSFKGKGTQLWIRPLEEYILSNPGAKIQTNCQIQYVLANKKQVVLENGQIIQYKNLILACPIGSVDIRDTNIERPLKQHPEPIHNNTVDKEFRYTQYYAVCVQLNHMPTTQPKWTAVFEPTNVNMDLQVMSFTNLHAMQQMERCILIYVCQRFKRKTKANTKHPFDDILVWKDKIVNSFNSILFFQRDGCFIQHFLHYEYFNASIPVFNEAMFTYLQSIQGQESIYYSSQAMNSYPSLESACYSGRFAAHCILGTIDTFMEKIRRWDQESIQRTNILSFFQFSKDDNSRLLSTIQHNMNNNNSIATTNTLIVNFDKLVHETVDQAFQRITQEQKRKEDSIVQDIFQGYVVNTYTCQRDNQHQKINFARYLSLSLDYTGDLEATLSLDELLKQSFYKPRMIEGVVCANCSFELGQPNSKQNFVVKELYYQFPPILYIFYRRKIYVRPFRSYLQIDVPERLSMQGCNMQIMQYTLISVICHEGSGISGHYTCYCKINGQWFEFSDTLVKPVFIISVLRISRIRRSITGLFYQQLPSTS